MMFCLTCRIVLICTLICLSGCGKSNQTTGITEANGNASESRTASSGTQLAGEWSGEFVVYFDEGRELASNQQIPFSMGFSISAQGAVTQRIPSPDGTIEITYSQAGQVLLGNGNTLEIEKMEIQSDRIVVVSKDRSSTVADEVNGIPVRFDETESKTQMVLMLKNGVLEMESQANHNRNGRRTISKTRGKFTRIGSNPSTRADAGPKRPTPIANQTKNGDYYPLQVGLQKQYRANGKTLISKITSEETIGNETGFHLEITSNGQLVGAETLAARKDGIYRLANNGMPITPPVLVLKLPALNGQSWPLNFQILGVAATGESTTSTEQITVPAGTFSAIKVRSEVSSHGQNVVTEMWFVRDVGMVRQQIQTNGQNILIELEK